MKHSIVILLILGTAAAASGATVTYDWTGAAAPDLSWANGTNWSQAPDIGHPVPGIWGGSPYSTVNIASGIVTVGSGVLAGANTLNMTSGSQINLVGSSPNLVVTTVLNNAGQINVSGGRFDLGDNEGAWPWNNPAQPIVASGGGTINLTGGQLLITSPLMLAGQNIQGNGTGLLTCNGLPGLCLTLLPGNSIQANGGGLVVSSATINNTGGLLQAVNGGTLQLGGGHNNGPTYISGGTIQAQDGSTVLLGYHDSNIGDSAGSVTASTLNTFGSGVIQASNGMVLDSVTNNGNLQIVNSGVPNNDAVLANTIDNKGTITLAGGNIRLNVQTFTTGAATLTGGGIVNLGGYSISGYTNNNANGTLTNMDNRIQGAGTLSNLTVINQSPGVIDANTSGQTLSFPGSTLTNQGTVRVGAGSSMSIGILTNLSGGTLTGGTYDVVGTLSIPGAISNNAATIILDGVSSSLVYGGTTDALALTFADNRAAGTFEILNGRNFTTAGAFSNEGVIDVGAGSTLTINGALTNTGSLDINGTLVAQSIGIGDGQSLSGSGTVDGDVTVYGETDPGNSPGILTIDGNYTQASGSFLNIQLGGTGLGQFDQLNVNGDISLAGTLDILLWNGFVPGNGDTFDILNWTGKRTGWFDAIHYPTLSAGYYFEPLWGTHSLTLEVGYTGGGSGTPEPATCFLIGAGLLVGIYRWRARRPIA